MKMQCEIEMPSGVVLDAAEIELVEFRINLKRKVITIRLEAHATSLLKEDGKDRVMTAFDHIKLTGQDYRDIKQSDQFKALRPLIRQAIKAYIGDAGIVDLDTDG